MRTSSDARQNRPAFSRWIAQARRDPFFAQLWKIDPLFKPYAAASLTLCGIPEMSPAARSTLYRRIATEPRTRFLTELTGIQVRAGALRLLAKADYRGFLASDWQALLKVSNDPDIRRELHGLDRISPVLVRQIPLVPRLTICAAVLNVLNQLAVSEEHWRQLATSLDDASSSIRNSVRERAGKIHSVGSFWDFFFACVDGVWKPFALPEPFFASPLLTPLASAREMRREGLRMKNCMGELVRGVLSGWDAYFHWNGSVPASVQLIRAGDQWELGQIAAKNDEPVNEHEAAKILDAAQEIIDRTVKDRGITRDPCAATIDSVREQARKLFPAKTIERVARELRLIRGKSLPGSGSFCVIEGRHGYIQLMAGIEKTRYWCELQSHQFVPETEARLTDPIVSLIRACGFRWPEDEQNFGRHFWVGDNSDVSYLAEFALGILNRVFDQMPRMRLKLETNLPDKKS
jgi:hypothetical protein